MNGADLHELRVKLGIGLAQLGLALGYSGNPGTLRRLLRRMENDTRQIPAGVQKIAHWYAEHGLIDNVPAPLSPRVVGSWLLHGEPLAIEVLTRRAGARNWLRACFQYGGPDYYQVDCTSPPVALPTDPIAPMAVTHYATIRAARPIVIKGAGWSFGAPRLVGAELTIADGRALLGAWVHERQRRDREEASNTLPAGITPA